MSEWRRAVDWYIEAHRERWINVRRHLHVHPEPSREEYETTRFLAEQVKAAGMSARVAPTGRGLIAEPEGQGEKARIAIRADIDALRIQDAKSVPYRSCRDGVMHACGHDAHSAMVLAAASALASVGEGLPRQTAWRAIFQPSEEIGEGAFEMVAAGAMEKVRAITALHVDPDLESGRIAHRTGILTAYCQELAITIKGMGGHAARPHLSVDPIAVAVQLINSIYQFVPRSVDSRDPKVITFGCIQGGTSANVIPEEVKLMGIIRTLTPAAAARVEEQVRRIARGLSEASRAAIDVTFRRGTEAVTNDPSVTATCVEAAREVVGAANVVEIALPSMGGEDFSGYLKHAPGCLLRVGVAAALGPRQFLHSPLFDIDEHALLIGAKVLARSVVMLSSSSAFRSHAE
jgi:amidohydrolase